jgi:hypothetical protein
VLDRAGLAISAAAVIIAPLAVGGVHRGTMILLMFLCALGLGALYTTTSSSRPLRLGVGAALPLVLLAIPILQSIPLPLAIRGLLDHAGNDLLLGSDPAQVRFWPLSLDPVPTREHIGTAACGLAIFLVAFHFASGKTRRHVFPRVVALCGVAAVVIGLGHKIFGIAKIYGLFTTIARSSLTGPFVNANHNAEFLELAAFACFACSFQRNTALNRYGWWTGALLCIAGAIGTMSRGAILGILAGASLFVVLRYLANDPSSGPTKRWIAWGFLAALLVMLTAGALGAGSIVDRFRSGSVSEDVRFHLWRDSLSVLAAHPAGIGRGAFERVYPAYRTVKTDLPVTFAYVENQSLQLLIDSGWLFFGAILVGVGLVLRQLVRHGRRDKIEAALLAGLFAVLAHSLVDFGLETLGVMLPFLAILATVLGRCAPSPEVPRPSKAALPLVVVTCAGLLAGAIAIALPSDADFDKLLNAAHGAAQIRAVVQRARSVHPTDYFFALAYAQTEPLRSSSGRSPRLHALNRALELCPGCDLVHIEVARSLWALGSRGQALVEWRTVLQLQPSRFEDTMKELTAAGAKAQDLAALASFDAAKMVEAANFLARRSQISDALVVLDEADLMGAPRAESLLARGHLQLQSNQLAAAQTTLAEAHAAGILDPRLSLLDAELLLAVKGRAGVDDAFAILDLAAIRYPLDLPVQRMRVSMVSQYGKWQAAERALDGFKMALYQSTGSAFEANLTSARIRGQLGQLSAALSDYRTALAQSPNEPSLWVEYAQVAENAGRDQMARDAYGEAARLAPSDASITEARRRLDARQTERRNAGREQGFGVAP